MDYNYHTHTFRCGHAAGTEREYLETALNHGIRRMGFSDHIAFAFPDGYESGFRVPVSEVGDYFSTLRALREEYRGRIEIRIGFETEYYPKYFDAMLRNAAAWGAEYLILGQHFIANEHPGGNYCGEPSGSAEGLHEYADCVIAAMETGVITYIAHPDLFHFTGSEEVYDAEMRRICRASVRTRTPLEINFLGIRGGRHYPNERFWRIAGEEHSPVTFGLDAHRPEDAFDGASLKTAQEMVGRFDLNYTDEPKLRPLAG